MTDDGTGRRGKSDDGTDDSPAADVDAGSGRRCPHCETPMYERHCKYVCPNHGVVMDCSDTFW